MLKSALPQIDQTRQKKQIKTLRHSSQYLTCALITCLRGQFLYAFGCQSVQNFYATVAIFLWNFMTHSAHPGSFIRIPSGPNFLNFSCYKRKVQRFCGHFMTQGLVINLNSSNAIPRVYIVTVTPTLKWRHLDPLWKLSGIFYHLVLWR